MKYQVLFSLKNNEEKNLNVVCCSCDWRHSSLKYIQVLKVINVQY